MRDCVFCDRAPLESRVFYDQGPWYALLAAPPYVRGQTILALKNSTTECPTALTPNHLRGLDTAIPAVAGILMTHFRPKDILVASLRGRDPHVHFHLMPLWPDEETAWREKSHRQRGHLFEFLGHIEFAAEERARNEREQQALTEEEQRRLYGRRLLPEVRALRELSSYGAA
jgi:diadenosine tetraphosphate (Ap4A) HIT family hydrolase